MDRNGFAFSETAELLGFLLSGRQLPVPVSRERLRDYPEASKPGHLDRLLGLPHELVLTQSWGSHTGAAAKKLVKRHQKLLVDSGDDAGSQVAQLTQVMDGLTSGRLGLGDHHATLLIYGDTAEGVRQALAHTTTALAEEAIGFRPLEKALKAGFWAQLPGN